LAAAEWEVKNARMDATEDENVGKTAAAAEARNCCPLAKLCVV
jgi:hypothetical protein